MLQEKEREGERFAFSDDYGYYERVMDAFSFFEGLSFLNESNKSLKKGIEV